MPKVHREKVAEIHKVTVTQTRWERFIDGVKAVCFVIFLFAMAGLFLG